MSIQKTSVLHADVSELFGRLAPRTVRLRELSIFCRKMEVLLTAGIPIKKAVLLLAGQEPLRDTLVKVHAGIMQGKSLSAAMTGAGVFPPFFCGMCRIGEMTARLPQVMSQLAAFYERQSQMEDELRAALVYPAAVTSMMLAVTVIAVVFVLPGYSRVFAAAGAELPLFTRALMRLSDALAGNMFLVLAGLGAVILSAALFLRSASGRLCVHYCCLYAPAIRGVYRLHINLRLSQALVLLLSSGQRLTDAVPAAAGIITNNLVLRDWARLTAGLAEGRPFWLLLSRIAYIDPMLVNMAQVGEETGRLSMTVGLCRDHFEREHLLQIRRLNKLVEPAITIVLGLVLGLVMLAVILPTFALTDIY